MCNQYNQTTTFTIAESESSKSLTFDTNVQSVIWEKLYLADIVKRCTSTSRWCLEGYRWTEVSNRIINCKRKDKIYAYVHLQILVM